MSGVPTVLVHTAGFIESAPRQAEALGQPAMRRVVVPHPVQQLTRKEVIELAEDSAEDILAALTR